MERTPHINATNFHTDNFLGRIWRAWKSFWRTRRSMGSTTSQQAGPQDHISKTWNRPICFRSNIGQICNLCHISGNRSRTGKVAWFFIVCLSFAKYLQKMDIFYLTQIRFKLCNFFLFSVQFWPFSRIFFTMAALISERNILSCADKGAATKKKTFHIKPNSISKNRRTILFGDYLSCLCFLTTLADWGWHFSVSVFCNYFLPSPPT